VAFTLVAAASAEEIMDSAICRKTKPEQSVCGQ
jgi:hypothetical protein